MILVRKYNNNIFDQVFSPNQRIVIKFLSVNYRLKTSAWCSYVIGLGDRDRSIIEVRAHRVMDARRGGPVRPRRPIITWLLLTWTWLGTTMF